MTSLLGRGSVVLCVYEETPNDVSEVVRCTPDGLACTLPFSCVHPLITSVNYSSCLVAVQHFNKLQAGLLASQAHAVQADIVQTRRTSRSSNAVCKGLFRKLQTLWYVALFCVKKIKKTS